MMIVIDPALIMIYTGLFMLIALAVIFWWNDF